MKCFSTSSVFLVQFFLRGPNRQTKISRELSELHPLIMAQGRFYLVFVSRRCRSLTAKQGYRKDKHHKSNPAQHRSAAIRENQSRRRLLMKQYRLQQLRDCSVSFGKCLQHYSHRWVLHRRPRRAWVSCYLFQRHQYQLMSLGGSIVAIIRGSKRRQYLIWSNIRRREQGNNSLQIQTFPKTRDGRSFDKISSALLVQVSKSQYLATVKDYQLKLHQILNPISFMPTHCGKLSQRAFPIVQLLQICSLIDEAQLGNQIVKGQFRRKRRNNCSQGLFIRMAVGQSRKDRSGNGRNFPKRCQHVFCRSKPDQYRKQLLGAACDQGLRLTDNSCPSLFTLQQQLKASNCDWLPRIRDQQISYQFIRVYVSFRFYLNFWCFRRLSLSLSLTQQQILNQLIACNQHVPTGNLTIVVPDNSTTYTGNTEPMDANNFSIRNNFNFSTGQSQHRTNKKKINQGKRYPIKKDRKLKMSFQTPKTTHFSFANYNLRHNLNFPLSRLMPRGFTNRIFIPPSITGKVDLSEKLTYHLCKQYQVGDH